MTTADIIAAIKMTNNGRLLSYSMNAAQHAAAKQAVADGVVIAKPFTMYLMAPGVAYSLAKSTA